MARNPFLEIVAALVAQDVKAKKRREKWRRHLDSFGKCISPFNTNLLGSIVALLFGLLVFSAIMNAMLLENHLQRAMHLRNLAEKNRYPVEQKFSPPNQEQPADCVPVNTSMGSMGCGR